MFLAAAALCVPAASGRSSLPRSSARPPVVYGYPYASRCPAAGEEDVVDRWGMYMCNCTSYVAWALQANHQRIDWFVRGAMDAWNWPNVARRRGLHVGRSPSVRAVAVWPKSSRPFGHLAYVTGVERDGRFDVSEYNLAGASSGPFTFDRRSNVSRSGAVFIVVPTA